MLYQLILQPSHISESTLNLLYAKLVFFIKKKEDAQTNLSDLKLCKKSEIGELCVALHVCLTIAWAFVEKKPPELTQSVHSVY